MRIRLRFHNGILQEIKIRDDELTIYVDCEMGVISMKRKMRFRRATALTAFFIREHEIDKMIDFIEEILAQGGADLRVLESF